MTLYLILASDTRFTRHKRKLRDNIEVLIELSFRAGKLLHDITSSISAGLPGHRSYNSKAIRPNFLKRRRIEVLETLSRSLIRYKVIKLQSKNDCMIVRAKRQRTILTGSKETNTFTKFLSKTLHKKLKITLHKGHTRQSLAGLRISIVMNRNMIIIISKRYKVTGLVIFKLQHTAICPFTRSLQTATGTLSAGNLNKLGNITKTTNRRTSHTRKAFTRTFEMVYIIARHLKQPFTIFFA